MNVIAYQMRCEVYSKQKETRGRERERKNQIKIYNIGNKKKFNFRKVKTVLWLSTVNAIGFFSMFNLFFSPLHHITPKEFSFLLQRMIVVVTTFYLVSFVSYSSTVSKILSVKLIFPHFLDYFLLSFQISQLPVYRRQRYFLAENAPSEMGIL